MTATTARRIIQLALLVLLVSGGLLAAMIVYWRPAQPPVSMADLPKGATTIPSFRLTERSGKAISNSDLNGRIWVAGSVFTRCSGPCPMVTGVMARLRAELPTPVQLVTITVDPDHDNAQVLSEYAGQFRAPADTWWFLTGSRDEVYRLVSGGFRLAVEEDADPARPVGQRITHSTRLAVVDRVGSIRGYYDCLDAAAVSLLKRRVSVLLEESP